MFRTVVALLVCIAALIGGKALGDWLSLPVWLLLTLSLLALLVLFSLAYRKMNGIIRSRVEETNKE